MRGQRHMTTVETKPVIDNLRLKLAIRGAVQGVGFRPFVFRLAAELGVTGWVNNSPQGVFIEVEGPHRALEDFLLRLEKEKPPRSFIQSLEASWLDAVGYKEFEIRKSEMSGNKSALVLPDIATCPDCLREILNPTNRRHHYPFTNCTNCGPRFSIIESLPYDRANTSMKQFAMCPACQAEYDDPRNRRFHAQPNACSACGPQLDLWSASGELVFGGYDALLAAANAIRRGQIVAVKGIGGFHLLVDARSDNAVRRLRERKHREEKPLALMFASLESVKAVCEVSRLEQRLLRSPEAPIVLLRRLAHPHPSPLPQERQNRSQSFRKTETANGLKQVKQREMDDCFSLSPGERARGRASAEQTHFRITPSVAPGNPNLGVMLPSNPLHHLLMAELGFPVVATSGNLSDEPICTDEHEALERLGRIADVFLVHNRPIARHVDDSIVRVMLDREMVLRRARGYAPLPLTVGTRSTASPFSAGVKDAVERVPGVLAVGAHLKNAVALSVGSQVFISQHIGDLETEQANNAFRRVTEDLQKLYETKPEIIAADLHPDYFSTKFALERGGPQPQHPVMRTTVGKLPCLADAESGAAEDSRAPHLVQVQHHIAHVLSCMAENELTPPVLGVAWDGTGYGIDGTIWGSEFFLVKENDIERVAHLRPFQLPGGDAAIKEPRRSALSLLHELFGDRLSDQRDSRPLEAFSPAELNALTTMLARGLNSPTCCSVGRLFDAAASFTGVCQKLRFEGQAAMELEFALEGILTDEAYELAIDHRPSTIQLDWSPMIEAILMDVKRGVSVGEISARFHNALVEAIVAVARHVGEPRVVLSGGCFQNRYLTERTVKRLLEAGFNPYWHQRVPTNDGGIALGQVVAARREMTGTPQRGVPASAG
jgi:hydrogenase maturation protein HypF